MAFFKFRKHTDEPASAPRQNESIEAMRRRAKYRLTGAAVLVLIGVIGFPILFDKQPRPIAVDTPIEIPDRNKSKPLIVPALVPSAAPTPTAPDLAKPSDAPSASPALPVSAPVTGALVAPKAPASAASSTLAAAKTTANETPKSVATQSDKPLKKLAAPELKTDPASRPQALLDGQEPDKKSTASEGRFVVQVGAFSDATRAREVRLKVERAGLKTYTQVAQTKDGHRIRVRVGPFATKSEAEKAAAKIKKLDLPAALLTL